MEGKINTPSGAQTRTKLYKVQRSDTEIVVLGPEQFEAKLEPDSVGLVTRSDPEWADSLLSFTVHVRDMTDAELVACALGLTAYPQ